MRLSSLCALLLALLVGCTPSDQPQAPGSSQTITVDRGKDLAGPVFATQIAGPSTFLPPMPTAIVVLKPESLDRNRAFCQAFQRLPTVQEALAASVVAPNIVQTRWLTQLSEVPAHRAYDCDFLTGTYDYGRAAALMASVRTTPGAFAGQGPFLVLVVPEPTGLRLVGIDGSRYATSEFNQFVASWGRAVGDVQTRITSAPDSPGIVRSMVNLVAAVLRAVFGGAAGLIQGVISAA